MANERLDRQIASRLEAGALCVIVEDFDEILAVSSASNALKSSFGPVEVISAAAQDVMDKVEGLKRKEKGSLVVTDFLSVYGSNPQAARLIREIALNVKEPESLYPRLVLIEYPGVTIPPTLRGDVEFIFSKVPEIDELQEELKVFLDSQGDVAGALSDEERYACASAALGLARNEASRLFGRSLIEKGGMDAGWLRMQKARRVSERLGGALSFLEPDGVGTGGMVGLKAWLASRKEAFGSQAARAFGLPEPKGLLLLGPPGCGKSLTAKTVSREWELPLLRLDAGKLYGSLVGASEANTRLAIEAAEACSPCVLWIDEIEKAMPGKRSGGGDSGTSQRVFGTLLTWLQEKDKPVFVVATANKVADLPPELLRKGRFDEIFFVDMPSAEERSEIFEIHLKRHGADKVKLVDLIAESDQFSGAEIEQAIIEGMFTAFASKRALQTVDVLTALRSTVPLSRTMAEDIQELRAWAETRARPAGKLSTQAKNQISGAPIVGSGRPPRVGVVRNGKGGPGETAE